ncbi:hypothetical protein CUMW_150370 [Citrus unshiu]|nr:hypothetical protein CUMW_150370 [Citrus unshiu]
MGSGSKMVIMLVLSVLLILEVGWSEGCLEHERFALLRLRHFFSSPSRLQNWEDEQGDFCQWESVECSNTTGRVIGLDLSDTRNEDLGEGYLNASLFTPFQQLESLILSNNSIAGCVENEGLEMLSRLSNLKFLDLRMNLFKNSISSSLARLSSLTSLSLSHNKLEGSIEVKGSSKLQSLDLSHNNLNRIILSSLTTLSELYLSGMGFEGTFDVQEFDSLSNLEELYLSNNKGINNFVVPQDYRGLSKLKRLDLSGVGIRDGSELLRSMGSFPSLKTLFLEANNFTATTTQELHNFTNLEFLNLRHSSLDINLLKTIASFTSLKNLSMVSCEVNGVLDGQGFLNFKSLERLDMGGARNALNASFLQIIGESMASLKHLSLSYSILNANCTILNQA